MKTVKKRRKEGKTDYTKRFKMLKSGMPRIVLRKTNQHFIAQYVTNKEVKDKVETGINSKQLLKFGWPEEFKGSLKSVPAAYLTGFFIGKKIISKKMKTPIVDLGMMRKVAKSGSFAFINGLVDAGIKIKCGKEMFPDKDRIKGKHLKKDFSKFFDAIKSKIEKE